MQKAVVVYIRYSFSWLMWTERDFKVCSYKLVIKYRSSINNSYLFWYFDLWAGQGWSRTVLKPD